MIENSLKFLNSKLSNCEISKINEINLLGPLHYVVISLKVNDLPL